jgi:small-conductance mechanosensitive channel
LAAILLFVLRALVLNRLRKLTDRSRFTVDSVLVRSIALPLTLLAIAGLFVLAERLIGEVKLLDKDQLGFADSAAKFIAIAATIVFVDRFILGFIGGYSEKSPAVKNSKGVIQGLSRGLILCIGVLVVLGTMGISITPLIASLGITSLAVALALQPTLENFFSGVQLVLDKPIRVGDFIELSSGEQGFVDRIGWRTTWIKMLQNNTVIIPNSELSKSKIINYFYPAKELSVPVEVGVHYSSDLEHVERVTLEVAREILVSHEWGVDDYSTFVLFTAFDSSSINMTVMLRAKEYFNRFWVKSAFIKALHKRFAEEGIVIPYPIRAINTSQESAMLPIRNESQPKA